MHEQQSGPPQGAEGWVVCLCAAWCRTCDAYRGVLDEVGAQFPHLRFEWVDVEDDAALLGDELDIETFPTVIFAVQGRVRFMGPLLPQPGVLARLLASMQESSSGHFAVDALAQSVYERVHAARALSPLYKSIR